MIIALAVLMRILNWVSDRCDYAALYVSDCQIRIAEKEAAEGLIIESAARAELLYGRSRRT